MMEPETFLASRWTHGNRIFPTQILVSEHSVMRRKRSWLRLSEESINIRSVASVNITTGLVWSEIRIESSGGTDPLVSHGHAKADARRIKELIETLQSRPGAGPVAAVPADIGSFRRCAQTMKKGARRIRYCG